MIYIIKELNNRLVVPQSPGHYNLRKDILRHFSSMIWFVHLEITLTLVKQFKDSCQKTPPFRTASSLKYIFNFCPNSAINSRWELN